MEGLEVQVKMFNPLVESWICILLHSNPSLMCPYGTVTFPKLGSLSDMGGDLEVG